MRKKQSIRGKFLKVTLFLLFIFAIIMGLVSVSLVSRLSKEDSRLLMRQICDKEALRFDNKLNLVEHSVNMVYEYANELCGIQGKYNNVYSREYTDLVRELAVSVAERTDGAMAVYFRYNPEIVGNGKSGFFWSKRTEESDFEEEEPTDILAYNANDTEHVGWFFVPKQSGQPLWMTPYYNQNLDVFMISYIIPFYLKNGEFVGVIGMDIDFNSIMEIAGEVDLYETGEVALVDTSEHLVYYSENGQAKMQKLSNSLYNHITTINKSSELLEMTEPDGSVSVICCDRLANGMKLFVSVPLQEINANRDRLIVWFIVLSVFTFVVALVLISNNTARIIQPLKKLTEITSRYAQGDWSENYISSTSDEIQDLSEGIATMAKTTQSYIQRINNIARTDVLTGLKNKTYYLEYMESLTAEKKEETLPYAVVVMDLNLLKMVNDTYGHEMGDRVLKEAGDYISRIFQGSMVFRIGGDEFVALLTGESFDNREDLCHRFEEQMGYPVPGAEQIRLFISYGMAVWGMDGMNYEELFQLADERMYAMKKRMKMERNK